MGGDTFGKTQQKRKQLNLLKNMTTTKYVMVVCGCVNKKKGVRK